MNKKKALLLFIEFGVVIIFIIIFVIVNDQITQNKETKFKPIEDSLFYVYDVEKASVENSELVIKGWFFEAGKFRNEEHERIKDKKLGLMLYDIDGDRENDDSLLDGIKMKVTSEKRADVNEYFKCGYDYTDSGFVAKVDISKIDLANGNYQIVLKQDDRDYPGILSKVFLSKGELCFVNPKEKMELDVDGTDLEMIVNDGECLASSPDKHICIYQYKWDLYWIIENGFEFGENDRTYIQFQVDTTQFDKLPKDRIEEGLFWSDIGEHFEKNEITDLIDCGKYRVSKREIPKEYSVTNILTGYKKSNEWKWIYNIRPRYLFE